MEPVQYDLAAEIVDGWRGKKSGDRQANDGLAGPALTDEPEDFSSRKGERDVLDARQAGGTAMEGDCQFTDVEKGHVRLARGPNTAYK